MSSLPVERPSKQRLGGGGVGNGSVHRTKVAKLEVEDTPSSRGSPDRLESGDEDEEDAEASRKAARNKGEQKAHGHAGHLVHDALVCTIAVSHSTPTKRREKGQQQVCDRSEYVMFSLPSERHRMACVEIRPDRQLHRRIEEGQYVDCSDWAEGEDRRWRFGDGNGTLQSGEEAEVGGVSDSFRWKKWRDVAKQTSVDNNLGPTCYQCRRESDKERMQCRNADPLCRRHFCATCCKRYSYFAFGSESRSFICPVCRDCCNCSRCIRLRKSDHLMMGDARAILPKQADGMTIEGWLQETVRAQVAAPFDRVRLVDKALDVISPELSPKVDPEQEVSKKKRRSTVAKEGKEMASRNPSFPKSRSRKKSMPANINVDGDTDADADDVFLLCSATASEPESARFKIKTSTEPTSQPRHPVAIRFKMPPKLLRAKEYDSDGDTVGGYSDLESDIGLGSASSALTSLSSRQSPRPSSPLKTTRDTMDFDLQANVPETNAFLAAITGWVHTENGSVTSMPTPPQTDAEVEALAQGDALPRRKKRPPPQANIVRAPKHVKGAPLSPKTTVKEPSVPLIEYAATADPIGPAPPVIPEVSPNDLNGHLSSLGYPLPFNVMAGVVGGSAAPLSMPPPPPVSESNLRGVSGASLSEWLVDTSMEEGERIENPVGQGP